MSQQLQSILIQCLFWRLNTRAQQLRPNLRVTDKTLPPYSNNNNNNKTMAPFKHQTFLHIYPYLPHGSTNLAAAMDARLLIGKRIWLWCQRCFKLINPNPAFRICRSFHRLTDFYWRPQLVPFQEDYVIIPSAASNFFYLGLHSEVMKIFSAALLNRG